MVADWGLLAATLPRLQDILASILAEVMQGLPDLLPQPSTTNTSTAVTRLLVCIACALTSGHASQDTDCPQHQSHESQQTSYIAPADGQDEAKQAAVTSSSHMFASQCEVLSKATDTAQQQHQRQFEHAQPDAHTCSRLMHELLEPLANIGHFERHLCQGAILAMHPGFEANNSDSGAQGSIDPPRAEDLPEEA